MQHRIQVGEETPLHGCVGKALFRCSDSIFSNLFFIRSVWAIRVTSLRLIKAGVFWALQMFLLTLHLRVCKRGSDLRLRYMQFGELRL